MLAALLLAAALTGSTCANPSIISTSTQSVTTNNGLNHYTIAIVVRNIGTVRQPSNLLQSVEVLQDGGKVGQMGLQPLRAHQSQTVTYGFNRSADSGAGTTLLTFTLVFKGPSGHNVDCHAGTETTVFSL
jgi:hypothetical protein